MDIFNITLTTADWVNDTTADIRNASLEFSCEQCAVGELCDVIRGACLGRALAAVMGVVCGGLLVILTVGVLILVPALFNHLKQLSHQYRYRESHEYHRAPNKCDHVTFSLSPPEVNHMERPFRLDIHNDFSHAPHNPRDLASPMTEEECLEDMSDTERNGEVQGSDCSRTRTIGGLLYPALPLPRAGGRAPDHGILKAAVKQHNAVQP